MKYILFSFTLLFFVLNTNFAQPTSPAADKEVLDGLDDIYNLRFDQAETKFKKLQQSDPNDLKGFFYESVLYFYKALPSRSEKYFDKYLELSDVVIEKSEEALEKNETDYDALYYMGLSHSYRSLLMLSLNKSLLKAASNGNDGYKILTTLVEKKPDYYDAYMGLGLYKIAIGFVPEKFQWLLSLIGFDGNIKEGMNYLKTSLKNGKFTKVESKVFLSIFSIKEKEDEDGSSLNFSKELTEQYPESAVFKVFYASLLLQCGFPEEAIRVSQAALSINNNSFKDEIIKSANAVIGTAYFRLNDYQKTIPHLEEFMKLVNAEDRYNVYLFTLGVSYELTGNRSGAIAKYKGVRNNFIEERDGELDKFFYRLAQEKIKTPVRQLDLKLIEGMNFRESNKLSNALNTYSEINDLNLLNSDDDKSRFNFELGLTYSYKKDFENAIVCFYNCINLKPVNEKWIVPHAYFELGKIYRRKGDLKQASDMFESILEYNDFDFESFLDMRLANYNK